MKLLTLAMVVVTGSALAQVGARVETPASASGPTAANDTAIWVHPTDPGKSLVFGTDRIIPGLSTYALDGTLRQQLPNLGLTFAVDVRYGVSLGTGTSDVVLAATLDGTYRLLSVDRDAGFLGLVDTGPTATGGNVSAASLYYSPLTKALIVFVADTTGKLRHYSVTSNGSGKLASTLVRTLTLQGQVDGIAADDPSEELYLTIANRGLYRLQAPSDGITTPTLIESIDAGRLGGAAGVAVYYTADAGGYVIVSASQTSRFNIYSLGTGAFLSSFNIIASDAGIPAVTGSRGIDVMNLPLGTTFGKGLFVAHDPNNSPTGPNYKLVGWDDVVVATGPAVTVDTRFDPRTFRLGDAGRPDAGKVDAGIKCVVPMVDAGTNDGGGVDAGDAGEVDAGPSSDAGFDAGCISGTGGGGGSNGGVGGGLPPIPTGGGGGTDMPMGCGCGQVELLAPLAALAWLLRRRRAKED